MAYITIDNSAIFYSMPRGRGNGMGQVLTLLIHGAGGSSRHWEPLLAHLSEQFCPLLIDLPGHGRSGGTVPRTIEQATTVIERFLDLLDVQQPLWCAGHSMGGLIAQYFALRFPTRVEGLILIATAARLRLHTDFARSALTGQWDLKMFRSSFGANIPLETQDLVLAEYLKMRVDANADFMELSTMDLQQEIAECTLPVLIITGDDDVIVSPRHSRTLSQTLTRSVLVVIPGGGHYVHTEQPQHVAQEFTRFFTVGTRFRRIRASLTRRRKPGNLS